MLCIGWNLLHAHSHSVALEGQILYTSSERTTVVTYSGPGFTLWACIETQPPTWQNQGIEEEWEGKESSNYYAHPLMRNNSMHPANEAISHSYRYNLRIVLHVHCTLYTAGLGCFSPFLMVQFNSFMPVINVCCAEP